MLSAIRLFFYPQIKIPEDWLDEFAETVNKKDDKALIHVFEKIKKHVLSNKANYAIVDQLIDLAFHCQSYNPNCAVQLCDLALGVDNVSKNVTDCLILYAIKGRCLSLAGKKGDAVAITKDKILSQIEKIGPDSMLSEVIDNLCSELHGEIEVEREEKLRGAALQLSKSGKDFFYAFIRFLEFCIVNKKLDKAIKIAEGLFSFLQKVKKIPDHSYLVEVLSNLVNQIQNPICSSEQSKKLYHLICEIYLKQWEKDPDFTYQNSLLLMLIQKRCWSLVKLALVVYPNQLLLNASFGEPPNQVTFLNTALNTQNKPMIKYLYLLGAKASINLTNADAALLQICKDELTNNFKITAATHAQGMFKPSEFSELIKRDKDLVLVPEADLMAAYRKWLEHPIAWTLPSLLAIQLFLPSDLIPTISLK